MTVKPDLTRVWAVDAPGVNVVDPSTTTPDKFADGWTAEVPPFEHFNFIQKQVTEGLAHINEQGIAVWDDVTTYPVGGLAKGSDGNVYKALTSQSDNDPVSDNGTNWVDWEVTNRVIRVTSIAAMEAYSAPVGYVFSLNAGGRSGVFDVISGDFSTELSADTENGIYIGLADDLTGAVKVARRRFNGIIDSKWFGAIGNNVNDDTLAMFSAIGFINDNGGNIDLHISEGTYLLSFVDVSGFTGGWRGALSGYEKLVLAFANVENVKVFGSGVLKSKDNGIPDNSAVTGIIGIFNSKNMDFEGLKINGNRNEQLHTLDQDFGHNLGFWIKDDCSYIHITKCHVKALGSLRAGFDDRGDGVYVRNGASNIYCKDNILEDVGRWGFVLESGVGGTDTYVIEGNTFYGTDPTTTLYDHRILGFVDIENYHPHSNIIIRNNIIHLNGSISFGGYSSSILSSLIENIIIEGNTWNCQGVAGGGGYNDAITMYSSGSDNRTIKTYKNITIKNNKFYFGNSSNSNNNRILHLTAAIYENFIFSDNLIVQEYSSSSYDNSGVYLENCALLGSIEWSGNTILGSSNYQRWFGIRETNNPTVTGYPISNFDILIKNNYLKNGKGVGFLQVDDSSLGSITSLDNVFKDNGGYVIDLGASTIELTTREFTAIPEPIAPAVTFTSDVAAGDTVVPTFKITADTVDASVNVNVVFNANDYLNSVGILQFTALFEGGTWTISTVTSSMTTISAPIVTASGSDIVISSRKDNGGSPRKPTISGTVATANCKLQSA